jgi:hypothetical protein
MKRLALAAAAALFLLAACSPSGHEAAAREALAVAAADVAVVQTSAPAPDAGGIPAEIRIPSSVGEVMFLHKLHFTDRGIKCVDCHHQINAKKLDTPHPDYLASSSINCSICHNGAKKTEHTAVYACSGCHHASPTDVADETMSAKVVIHKQCWKCHAVATGAEASESCVLCHSGKRNL